MIKLIKLEFKRNNIKPYFYSILGIFCFTFVMGFLFSALPKIEANNISSHIFSDTDMLVMMITIISMSCFAILGSIMYINFIICEYTTKNNILVFSYPQRRSNIFIAKFIFIFTFIFVFMILSNIISIISIGIIGYITKIIDDTFKNIDEIILISIVFALISNLISLIALRIGFWKKSIILTIITTIVFIAPLGNSVLFIKDNWIYIIFPLMIVLIFINSILFLGLLKKVDEMECI